MKIDSYQLSQGRVKRERVNIASSKKSHKEQVMLSIFKWSPSVFPEQLAYKPQINQRVPWIIVSPLMSSDNFFINSSPRYLSSSLPMQWIVWTVFSWFLFASVRK